MGTQVIETYQPIKVTGRHGIWLWLCLTAVIIGTGLFLVYPILRMGFTYQINFSEGWNLYHINEAMQGYPLYVDPVLDPFTQVTQPPFFFYIVGITGYFMGDYLFAGRIISIGSLLLIALLSTGILRSRNVSWKGSLLGGTTAIILINSYAQEYVGMNDAHLLAYALAFTGLFLYSSSGCSNLKLCLSALTLPAGLFISPDVVPVSMAIILDCFLGSRKKGFLFTSLYLTMFFLLVSVTGTPVINVAKLQYGMIPEYNTTVVLSQIMRVDIPILFLILIAIWTGLTFLFDQKYRLFSYYFGFAAFSGLLLIGGSSSNINLLFNLFFATSLLLGTLFIRIERIFIGIKPLHLVSYGLLPLLIVVSLLWNLPDRVPRKNTLELLNSTQSGFLRNVDFLKNTQGRIFCENLMICYLAGKPLEMDPYQTSEMAIRGEIDENLALLMFEAHQFSIIQLNNQFSDELAGIEYGAIKRSGSMTRNMRIAIARNYTVEQKLPRSIYYIPR